MELTLDEAGPLLRRLVEAAVRGEEVVLTREGEVVARLVSAGAAGPSKRRRQVTPERKRIVLEQIMEYGRLHATPGPDGARSQDFLYDDDGLWA